MFFFTSEAAVPIRSNPSESSEMVSQLLFGDIVQGFEYQGNWLKIQNLEDGYEGWVTKYMLSEISEEELFSIKAWQYIHSPESSVELEDGTIMRLPLGARLPIFQQDEGEHGKIFHIGNKKWQQRNNGLFPILPPDLLAVTAKKFLNIPYLWGGKGGYGIDCSGFVQTVYRMHGISIARDASKQVLEGNEITFEEIRVGDLAFFSKIGETKVSHVGIMLSKDEIIHSSGKVRIDKLNKTGLYSYEYQNHTHSLITLKRYFQWELQPEPKSSS